MDKLFSICDGWTTNGKMICSADPNGGIIDRNLAGLGWFVVFNNGHSVNNFFDTRKEAIDYFCNNKAGDA